MNLITDLEHSNKCHIGDALDDSVASPHNCSCGAIYRHLTIPQRLYDSEVNFSLGCFWDGGWTAALGDKINGWDANTEVQTYNDALAWLDKEVRARYPESTYVTGK